MDEDSLRQLPLPGSVSALVNPPTNRVTPPNIERAAIFKQSQTEWFTECSFMDFRRDFKAECHIKLDKQLTWVMRNIFDKQLNDYFAEKNPKSG